MVLLKNVTISLWIVTTIASVFVAKVACDRYEIDAVVLSLVQFAVASALLLSASVVTGSGIRRPGARHLFRLLLVSGAVFARETLKFASVAHIDINLFNAIKSLGPLVLIALDFALFRAAPPRGAVMAFGVLAFGGLLMGLDALIHPTTPTTTTTGDGGSGMLVVGVVCGLLSTVVECGATMGQKVVLKDAVGLDDASVQYYLSCFSMGFALINFVDSASHHGRNAIAVHVRQDASTGAVVVALTSSALLAFVSTQLSIKSLRRVSAAQYTLLDTLRRLISSVAACFVFGEQLNGVGCIGLVVSLAGVYLYARMSGAAKSVLAPATVTTASGSGTGIAPLSVKKKKACTSAFGSSASGSVSGHGASHRPPLVNIRPVVPTTPSGPATGALTTYTTSTTTTTTTTCCCCSTVAGADSQPGGTETACGNDRSSCAVMIGESTSKKSKDVQHQRSATLSYSVSHPDSSNCPSSSSSSGVACSSSCPLVGSSSSTKQETITPPYTTIGNSTLTAAPSCLACTFDRPSLPNLPSAHCASIRLDNRERPGLSSIPSPARSDHHRGAAATRGYGSDGCEVETEAETDLSNESVRHGRLDWLTKCEVTPLLAQVDTADRAGGLAHIV